MAKLHSPYDSYPTDDTKDWRSPNDVARQMVSDRAKLNEASPQDWDNARSAMNKQVGGQHYKECAIQPIEYIMANKLGYCAGNVVKYVTRHASKGGKQDLEKAKHYLEMLMEQEYGRD